MPNPTDRPNALETAILERIADGAPDILRALPGLLVVSREHTGVGSFTNLAREDECVAWDRHLVLGQLIHLPEVEHGLDAILFCRGNLPLFLER